MYGIVCGVRGVTILKRTRCVVQHVVIILPFSLLSSTDDRYSSSIIHTVLNIILA